MDLWLQDYTLEPIKNIGNRQYSSCAQVKNKKGQVLIAVASGYAKGMEIWNPEGNQPKNECSSLATDRMIQYHLYYLNMICVIRPYKLSSLSAGSRNWH